MTVPFTVRLPDDLHERIRSAASADLRSLNSEIVWLIENGLAARTPVGRGGAGAPMPGTIRYINPGGGQITETPDQGVSNDRDDA